MHTTLSILQKTGAFALAGFILFFGIPVFGQSRLENPLNQAYSTVPDFIAGALRVLVIVALPIITLFIVVAGFMFVKARGNPEELATAKRNFVYVILGAILILGAWVLATLIGGTVTQLVR